MLFLLCNIVFASSFLLAIKWMHNRGCDDIVTAGAVSYVVAFLALIPMTWGTWGSGISSRAWLTGGSMGICYFIAFFFAIYGVRSMGAAGTTVISALSILVPIVCGIFLWNERPNGWQVTGIVLALMSLLLIGSRRKSAQQDRQASHVANRVIMLLAFFLLCGCARLAQAAYHHVCAGEPGSHFTQACFAVASIPSLFVLILRRRKITRSEWRFGIVMGLANALQTQFIILALGGLDSFVVFPVTSAGGLLLTTVVAVQFFEERLWPMAYVGISLTCVALVLLNW